jgi:nucleoside-diphosphate-sugar epimerase
MKILLTGASGFLGKIIHNALKSHDVVTLGRKGSILLADLTLDIPVLPDVDIVIHSAGKAHSIPKSSEEIKEFFDVNVEGTKNLLEGLKLSGLPERFVYISSVSVYGKSTGRLISEDTPLAAKDPYGMSKIEAEKLVQQWCRAHNVICTIFRLPLIAGRSPKGNLESMINGIQRGYYFNINGGNAKKSIVLADDIAEVIVRSSEIGGVYNLTDGYHPSFAELSSQIAKQLGRDRPHNISLWFAKLIGWTGDILGSRSPINTAKLSKITSDLTFDDSKARRLLSWNPRPVLEYFCIK